MMPINHIFRKYKLSKSQEKINHVINVDELQLFAKDEKELEILKQTMRIYSQYTGMEFGIEKCAGFVMKSGKWHMTEGVELPNQVKFSKLGIKKTCKY